MSRGRSGVLRMHNENMKSEEPTFCTKKSAFKVLSKNKKQIKKNFKSKSKKGVN